MFPATVVFCKTKSQTGQSLIEIIATIAIGTVLILALVALSVRANRSSDFSKAQSQAAKLASEGLEVINYLRDSGTNPVTTDCVGSGGSGVSWNDFFIADIVDSAPGCSWGADSHPGRKGVFYQSTPDSWELLLNNNRTDQITLDGRIFTRNVYIADSSPYSSCNQSGTDYYDIKQFTIVVSWDDTTGHHEATTTSCVQRL